MFDLPPRPPRVKRAHVFDAGPGMAKPHTAQFMCTKCEWQSDWLEFDTQSEIRAGIPCPNCNSN